MSPIIGGNYDDAMEPIAVEPGEYKLRIIGEVKVGEDKNGLPYMLPRFEIDGVPNAKEFTKFLRLVHDGMTEKESNTARYRIKEFCIAFGIDPSALGNTDEWAGLEGWAILGVEESTEYGEQNYVKKFVIGN